MRVVFLGYQTWGHTTLGAVLAAGHDVPLVLTHAAGDDPYERLWPDSVAGLAADAGIPVTTCRRAQSPDVVAAITAARPDILVSSDWRTWLDPGVLGLAPRGGINVHDGLLPRYGGFSPVVWAVANGEVEVGVTVHHMTSDLDLGDIVLQRRVPIHPDDTAADVVARTMPLFAALPVEALAALERGDAPRIPQDPAGSTFYHRRTDRDRRIDWARPPRAVRDLVRAQADPYPNAFTHHSGRRLYVKRAALPHRPYRGTPGRVFVPEGDGVVVVCGEATGELNQGLVLLAVQPEGGDPIAAVKYFSAMGEDLG